MYNINMRKWALVLILALLLAACSQTADSPTAMPEIETGNGGLANVNDEPLAPTDTLGADCYGEDPHPIGQAIAEVYPDQTNYEQVMVWFCNGFEFEDIMTALQTAEETDYTANALLIMFESGKTWEEIWTLTGLIEE